MQYNPSSLPYKPLLDLEHLPSFTDFDTLQFDSALFRASQIQSWEKRMGVEESWRTILLHHGKQTAHSVLLLGGLGEPTARMLPAAECLHREYNCNVLIPRMDHHNSEERKGDIAKISARRLHDTVRQATDIASSLGETTNIAGVSLGAVTGLLSILTRVKRVSSSSTTSLTRPKFGAVVLMEPPFGLEGIPDKLRPAVRMAVLMHPDSPKLPFIGVNAPGGSSHAIAAVAELIFIAERRLISSMWRQQTPSVKQLTVIYDHGPDHITKLESAELLIGRLKRLGLKVKGINKEFPWHKHGGEPLTPDEEIEAYATLGQNLINPIKGFIRKSS